MADKVFSGNAKEKETKYGKIYKLGWKADELIEQINKYKKDNGWFNIDLLFSKGGQPYMVVDTFGLSEKQKTVANNDEWSNAKVAEPQQEEIPF